MVKRDRKSEERNKLYVLLFVAVVSLTMIFSVFYTGSQEGSRILQNQETEKQLFNQYKVQEVGNSSILVKIKSKTDDVIITFPLERYLTQDMIRRFRNLSSTELPGLNYATCDSTDKYLLCTANIKTETFSALNEKLADIFNRYVLKRAFIGELQQPYITLLGVNETYIISNLNYAEGTYIKAWLYQKELGGFIGFEEKALPLVNRIPATVLNISHYVFSGILDSDFSVENFSAELNLNRSEVEFSQPKILLDFSIGNETLSELNSLSGVSATIQENVTAISFNNSLSGIRKILLRENLTYGTENGKLQFNVPVESNVSTVKSKMLNYAIKNISVEKQGIVSFSEEVISNGRLIRIENSQSFSATLEEKTNAADKINLSLSIIQFGSQIIPMGAREIFE